MRLNDAEQDDEDPRFVCASQNTLQTVAILTKKQKLFMVNFNFYVDRKFAISSQFPITKTTPGKIQG